MQSQGSLKQVNTASSGGDQQALGHMKRPSSSSVKELKPDLAKYRLPQISTKLQPKQIRLAYTMNSTQYTNPFNIGDYYQKKKEQRPYIDRLGEFSTIPITEKYSAIQPKLHKVQSEQKFKRKKSKKALVGTMTTKGDLPGAPEQIPKDVPLRRPRPPKTQFKIKKSNQNIHTLESILCNYIDQHKHLKSKGEDPILHPQNRIQASMPSLRQINNILPQYNLVNKNYGYDEDNLNKNHLTLEKVMLERISKTKKRREDLKEQKQTTVDLIQAFREEMANHEAMVNKNAQEYELYHQNEYNIQDQPGMETIKEENTVKNYEVDMKALTPDENLTSEANLPQN